MYISIPIIFSGFGLVKCCQSGKIATVKLGNLVKEDSTLLSAKDFIFNADLLYEQNGKLYPIRFIKIKGNVLLYRYCIAD